MSGVYESATASTSSGPLFRTSLTRVLTRRARNWGGALAMVKAAVSDGAAASQELQASRDRATGIRLWRLATGSAAAVVRIVQVRNGGDEGSLGRHTAHRPAKASGLPSAAWKNHGCLRPLSSSSHS